MSENMYRQMSVYDLRELAASINDAIDELRAAAAEPGHVRLTRDQDTGEMVPKDFEHEVSELEVRRDAVNMELRRREP